MLSGRPDLILVAIDYIVQDMQLAKNKKLVEDKRQRKPEFLSVSIDHVRHD